MKLSTINQIVEAILAASVEHNGTVTKEIADQVANEATIYLKTALICEDKGIDEAMEYLTTEHSQDEYQEFLTGVVNQEDNK